MPRIASSFTRLRFTLLLVLAYAAWGTLPMLAQWQQPTPEELSMTSQPQVPGAAAVYLFYEHTTDDSLQMQSYYVRLKVLTEAGKEYANVKLEYEKDIASHNYGEVDFGINVTDIEGRTIHSDGTVVPFTGKPYRRTVEKSGEGKVDEMVFTLPDVEVGSILEYRYKMRIPDNWLEWPSWYVQQDLFAREEHFSWKASDDPLVNELGGEQAHVRAWTPFLPQGVTVTSWAIVKTTSAHTYHQFELKVQDVPPIPEEEFMPPVHSFTYRVNFYYVDSIVHSPQEFWKNEGADWAKSREKFIGSPKSMADAVATLVAPGDNDTVKLQKIYAAIMAMDNTSYSRQHDTQEDKAHGLKDVKNAQDVWQRKSGEGDQLTGLFIALARAAGLKAYDMRVTDRDTNIFWFEWLSLRQLDDDVAIVVLDGKEQFFDPGQRYCPFGQMAWKHTDAGGIRETDQGTALANTPDPPYLQSQTQRIADLTLDADGTAKGVLRITWIGAEALSWRQDYLRGDEESLKRSMREWMEARIPAGLEPEVDSIENLADYEKPLVANFNVHGPLGTATAKRFILPGQFFEADSKPLFPHPTRNVPIYFDHAGRVADAVRYKFPADFQVESAPKDESLMLEQVASYRTSSEAQGNAILMRRDNDLGIFIFMPKEYGDVKTFYDKMSEDDQEPVILLRTAAAANAPAETGTGHDKNN